MQRRTTQSVGGIDRSNQDTELKNNIVSITGVKALRFVRRKKDAKKAHDHTNHALLRMRLVCSVSSDE